MILLIVFLPLFALLLNYAHNFLDLLHSRVKVQKKCRIQAYKAQTEIISGFNSLIQMNPEAKTLRARRRKALRAVKYAVSPKAKAAAVAYLAFVTAQQLKFQFEQQKIIMTSKSRAKLEMLKVSGPDDIKSPAFALEARPSLSLSPSYYAPPNLAKKQEIIIPWTIKNRMKQTLKGQCGSYVKRMRQQFIAKLSYLDT